MASIENLNSQEKVEQSTIRSDSRINSLNIMHDEKVETISPAKPSSQLPSLELVGNSSAQGGEQHKGFFDKITDAAKDVAHKGEDIYHKGEEIVTNVATGATDLFKTVKDSTPVIGPILKKAGGVLWDKVDKKLNGTAEGIAGEFSEKKNSVETFASNIVDDVSKSVKGAEKSAADFLGQTFGKGREVEKGVEEIFDVAKEKGKEFVDTPKALYSAARDPVVGPDVRKWMLHQVLLYEEGLTKGLVLNAVNGYTQYMSHLYGPIIKGITGKDPIDLTIKFPNEKEVDSSTFGKVGTVVGQISQAVLLAAFTGGGSLPLQIGKGALIGGMLTPTSDNNFWRNRLENTAFGAAGGLFSHLGGKTMGSITESAPETVQLIATEFGKKSFGAAANAVNDELRHLINEGKALPPVQLAKDVALGLIPGLGPKNRAS
jgi:hypothetical protein